jgi:hypothetical protein
LSWTPPKVCAVGNFRAVLMGDDTFQCIGVLSLGLKLHVQGKEFDSKLHIRMKLL